MPRSEWWQARSRAIRSPAWRRRGYAGPLGLALPALLCTLSFHGCDGTAPRSDVNGMMHAHTDADASLDTIDAATEPHAGDANAATVASCPDDTLDFANATEAYGEQRHLGARVLSAHPSPPARFLNDWHIELIAPSGSRVEDAYVETVRSFMPVHGHDGGLTPTVHHLEDPGTYNLEGINFNMRGPWEVQLELQSPSLGADYVAFRVCVQG